MPLRKALISVMLALAVTAVGHAPRAHAATIKPSEEALKAAGDKFDVALWDRLLHKYVDTKGRVDYARLRATAADLAHLDRLYAQVGRQRLGALPDKSAQLAFLINAYNVCVWKNVLMRPPFKDLTSQAQQQDFFGNTEFLIAGQPLNLNKLENEWIRERFKDPRIHMAVNCASGGCPQLPNEAFTPARLDKQLDREARKFCNEARNVQYDPATKTAQLSHIFDWYAKDFGDMALAFINKYRAPAEQIPADAKIQYVEYDWHLNDMQLPR
ncbi:MAG TPA: DUF547 domain-containing protein [Polyangia bacterium]|jgi:hypothetical protein|nr:DUF547 domain-containing protein [Polyangia bacterium]